MIKTKNHKLIMLLLSFLVAGNSFGSTPREESNEFISLYNSLCLKNIYKLEEFKKKLSKLPSLPEKSAKFFLGSNDGKSWPVPSKHGKYVLSISSNNNFCSLSAMQGDINVVESIFRTIVKQTPEPLISQQLDHGPNSSNLKTIAYQWYKEGSRRATLFKLTTNNDKSQQASIKILASVSTFNR